jgi:hypothetical protein
LSDAESHSHDIQLWAVTYQVIAWYGALCGFYFARLWGGWKSVVGRANLAFAMGLLAQSFGQSVFSYYFYNGVHTPYPSLADLGFFGSIPFYIYGAVLLVKFTRFKFRSLKHLAPAFVIPIVMLVGSYILFLKGYQIDPSDNLRLLLDFGYPLGQAIYVSIAILALIISSRIMKGIMIKATLLFILSLVMQYISDFTFLYTSINGTFVGGGMVDYLYMVSYFFMALSLVYLGKTF